jgi:hypothetical protein
MDLHGLLQGIALFFLVSLLLSIFIEVSVLLSENIRALYRAVELHTSRVFFFFTLLFVKRFIYQRSKIRSSVVVRDYIERGYENRNTAGHGNRKPK